MNATASNESDVLYYQKGDDTRMRKRVDVKPFKQGAFDTACGVYAAVNLVTLSLALKADRKVSPTEAEALFYAAVEALGSSRRVARLIDGGGMRNKWWKKVVEAVCESAAETFAVQLRPTWHDGRADEATLVALINGGSPVGLLTKPQQHTHYTVVTGYSPDQFRLFDSFTYRQVNRSEVSGEKMKVKGKSIVTIRVG